MGLSVSTTSLLLAGTIDKSNTTTVLEIGNGYYLHLVLSQPVKYKKTEIALQETTSELLEFLNLEATKESLHDFHSLSDLENELFSIISPKIEPLEVEDGYLEHDCALVCGLTKKPKISGSLKTEDKTIEINDTYTIYLRWKIPLDYKSEVKNPDLLLPELSTYLKKMGKEKILHDPEKLKIVEKGILRILQPAVKPASITALSLDHNCYKICKKARKKMGIRIRVDQDDLDF